MLREFLSDESGATALEYGLIAALVVITAMVAVTQFADSVIAMLGYVSSSVSAVP